MSGQARPGDLLRLFIFFINQTVDVTEGCQHGVDGLQVAQLVQLGNSFRRKAVQSGFIDGVKALDMALFLVDKLDLQCGGSNQIEREQ